MVVSHDMGISNDSSFGQAVLNGEFHHNYLVISMMALSNYFFGVIT